MRHQQDINRFMKGLIGQPVLDLFFYVSGEEKRDFLVFALTIRICASRVRMGCGKVQVVQFIHLRFMLSRHPVTVLVQSESNLVVT